MENNDFRMLLEQNLPKLRVATLKQVLSRFCLRKSGNKADLVTRILEYADRTGLNEEIYDVVTNPFGTVGPPSPSSYQAPTIRHPSSSSSSSSNSVGGGHIRDLGSNLQSAALYSGVMQALNPRANVAMGQEPDESEGEGRLLERARILLSDVAKSDPFAELEQVVHDASLLVHRGHGPSNLMVSLSQVPRSLLMEPDVQVLVYCVQVAKGRKELEEDRKLVNAGKSLPMQAKVVRWPPAAAVYANQKAVKLIQQAPDGRLRTKAVRERPADITKFVSSSSQKANLRITHPYCELRDEGARFAISVVVSRRLTTPRLLERLTTTPYDHSLKLVRDVFGDGEIEMGQVAVSLRDNVTFMPIEVPVRGKDCTHVQCFDAGGFLDFQRIAKNAQFRCPVCNKAPLFPANLRTDPWFTEIIQKVRDSGDSVDKVEYFSDGRWQPYVEGSLDSAAPSSNSSEPRGLKRPGSFLESDRQPSLPVLQSLTPEQDSRPATPQLPDSMPGSREDDDGAIVILDSDDDE